MVDPDKIADMRDRLDHMRRRGAADRGTSPAHVVRAIAHVRDLVGIDHVGLGSDYDGAVTTSFDASRLAVVTQALVDAGFTPDDIRKVMGGNILRVVRAGMVPLA